MNNLSPKSRIEAVPHHHTGIEILGLPNDETINFVFEQNPNLGPIGTEKQYSQYLETIFPNSLVKSPVYHETKTDWFKNEKFSIDKIGETDYGYYGKGFYFSSQKGIPGGYGKNEFFSLLDIQNPKYHIDTHTVGKQILSGLTKPESRTIATSWLQTQIQHYSNEIKNLENGIIRKHTDIPKGVEFETYWENRRVQDIKNLSVLVQEYQTQLENIDILIDEYYSHDGLLTSDNLDNYEEIMVRDPNQIHILGSASDEESFRQFTQYKTP